MTEREIEFLVNESRQSLDGIVDRTSRVDNILKRTTIIVERMRLLMDHQRTLDEVYHQTSDGIRRKQLLEEMQKENKELHECKEANDALSKGLNEGFEIFNELMIRKRDVEKRIDQENKIHSLFKDVCSVDEFPDIMEKLYVEGQKQAIIKDKMRSYASKVHSQMRLGELEASDWQEKLALLQTRIRGLREILTPVPRKNFNEFFKKCVPRLIELNDYVIEGFDEEIRKERIEDLKKRFEELRRGKDEHLLSDSEDVTAVISAVVECDQDGMITRDNDVEEINSSVVEIPPTNSQSNHCSQFDTGDANLICTDEEDKTAEIEIDITDTICSSKDVSRKESIAEESNLNGIEKMTDVVTSKVVGGSLKKDAANLEIIVNESEV